MISVQPNVCQYISVEVITGFHTDMLKLSVLLLGLNRLKIQCRYRLKVIHMDGENR